jgi:hypothetical protein
MEPVNHLINSFLVVVTQFAVIHMEAYHNLFAFDSLVGYTWIIWIDFESDIH